MKVRRNAGASEDKGVEIQMTPMIDIVFQLLIFFIMTFKIVSMEGDFNIRMPLAAPREGLPDDEQIPPMKVRLQAQANGDLASIKLNEKSFGTMEELRGYIMQLIGTERGPGSIQDTAEVELDCDYNLNYENVINVITAVSGYVDRDDNIVKLVEKIKFSPPRKPA